MHAFASLVNSVQISFQLFFRIFPLFSWKCGITVTVLSCYNNTEGAIKFSGVILAITVLNFIFSTIAQKGHK